MGSRIPLPGLVHRIDIVRKADAYTSAYTITPDGQSTKIYSNLRSRITTMSDRDEQEQFGNASGRVWRVIMKYSPKVRRGDFLSLASSCRGAPIDRLDDNDVLKEYRILYFKHQIDDVGAFHHTSLVIEYEDNEE